MGIEVEFSTSAESALSSIAFWFEGQNTIGGGERFLNNFEGKINRLKKSHPFFSPCGNKILKSKGLFCSKYRQWILAFEASPGKIIIWAIFHKRFLPQ